MAPRVRFGSIAKRYWVDPRWDPPAGRGMGGTRVVAILGIAASQSTNYGSKPSPDTPTAMKTLKKDHPSYNWKAGHLLNDGLGG
ncbi:MAG: hypothetical protein JO255_05730, partial [Alphaproteobacteria bacterium]|nr:hypothetical protein [Alphaproteobacteria bacterium]